MEARWSKLLSREFILPVMLVVVASVGFMQGSVTFIEWGMFSGSVSGLYSGTKAVKEVKLAKK